LAALGSYCTEYRPPYWNSCRPSLIEGAGWLVCWRPSHPERQTSSTLYSQSKGKVKKLSSQPRCSILQRLFGGERDLQCFPLVSVVIHPSIHRRPCLTPTAFCAPHPLHGRSCPLKPLPVSPLCPSPLLSPHHRLSQGLLAGLSTPICFQPYRRKQRPLHRDVLLSAASPSQAPPSRPTQIPIGCGSDRP